MERNSPLATRRSALLLCVWAIVVSGCGSGDTASEGGKSEARASTSPLSAPAAPVHTNRPRVVVLGDSLTAGLGLSPGESYPAILQQRLDGNGFNVEVVNAGVSGDTSAGGLRRLDWALEGDVRVLIVALGGNDGLRGLPPAELQKNLSEIVERARKEHVSVILAGMEAPPNLGPAYANEFRAAYRAVAEAHRVPLVPFLLDGVAGVASLNQPDGIHPTAEGARRVADTVWSALEPVIRASSRGVRPTSDPRSTAHD